MRGAFFKDLFLVILVVWAWCEKGMSQIWTKAFVDLFVNPSECFWAFPKIVSTNDVCIQGSHCPVGIYRASRQFCHRISYPRLPNTLGLEVWLDPKNIPIKHQTSGGIWMSSFFLWMKPIWGISYLFIWMFPKIGVPQNGWFIQKKLLKWRIWGYHYFRNTHI